jgi:hypothetical protein
VTPTNTTPNRPGTPTGVFTIKLNSILVLIYLLHKMFLLRFWVKGRAFGKFSGVDYFCFLLFYF